MTCQRIEGSESSSQSLTDFLKPSAFNSYIEDKFPHGGTNLTLDELSSTSLTARRTHA